jgi:hypothetical protein
MVSVALAIVAVYSGGPGRISVDVIQVVPNGE